MAKVLDENLETQNQNTLHPALVNMLQQRLSLQIKHLDMDLDLEEELQHRGSSN
jgi:hypothetical protein